MDKLTRYNKRVLAILGTLGIFLLLALLVFSISEMLIAFRQNNYQKEQGIVVNEIIEDKIIRNHLISFKKLGIVDSLQGLFLLPVNQTNLEDGEEIELEGLLNRSRGLSLGGGKNGYFSASDKSMNNLIIYNARNQTYEVLYETKVSIVDYQLNLSKRLIIEVVEADSNQDGYLNDDDLTSLHIYDFDKKQLLKVPMANKTFVEFLDLLDEEIFVVKLGLDRNEDGRFDAAQEAMYYYNLNATTGELKPLIPTVMIEDLQQILDEVK